MFHAEAQRTRSKTTVRQELISLRRLRLRVKLPVALGLLAMLAFSPVPVVAQDSLDPEISKPYQLQVVLGFTEHRSLTTVFQQRVERELRDGLQAALGNLAQVEVTRQHPRLEEVRTRSLQAMESWKFLSNSKIHFVLIDVNRGAYVMQSRQYDGSVGMASPVVRSAQLSDRQLVAREASLLVAQDFGMVGTIVGQQSDKVTVAFKGAQFLDPSNPWLKKDDVLAVAQILNQGGSGMRSERVPWTLLQVLEATKDGICQCALYHRFQNPLAASPGSLGFRCMKLGTTESKLRLRLVDDKGVPLNAKVVKFGRSGFDDESAEEGNTNANGIVQSKKPFKNIAFVKLLEGSEGIARVPLEVLDDRTVTCPVTMEKGAEQRSMNQLRRTRWLYRILEGVEMMDGLWKELPKLGEQSPSKALERAKEGRDSLNRTLGNLAEERAQLIKDGAFDQGMKAILDQADQHITALQDRKVGLEKYIKEQGDIIESENDPRRKVWRQMVQQGDARANQHDYDGAIQQYERTIAEGFDNAGLKEKVKNLKAKWTLKDNDHRTAREFIYKSWPSLRDAREISANFKKAQQAFETCKAKDDFLTPQKLLQVNVAHLSKLLDEIKELRPGNEDDRDVAKTIEKANDQLGKLNKEITDYLKAKLAEVNKSS